MNIKTLMKPLLKYENFKLKKQLVFDITSNMEVCGMECKGCYAIKAQKIFKNTKLYRDRQLKASKSYAFPDLICSELKRYEAALQTLGIKERIVRIHSSGEFYSNEYINKWIDIAKHNPNWTFYAFTKRIEEFPLTMPKLMKLPNMFITNSLYEDKINYSKSGDGYRKDGTKIFTCPATVSKDVKCSPDECTWCYQKDGSCENGVWFKQH